MIRKSLTRKMILVFSTILIVVIALNIIINGVLLPHVHEENKINAMKDLYSALYSEYESGSETDDVIEIVKKSLSKQNLRVFIWDKYNNLVIDSLPLSEIDPQKGTGKGRPEEWKSDDFRPKGNPNMRFPGRNEFYLLNAEIEKENIVTENKNYSIFSPEAFNSREEESLCLRGILPGGYRILIQMPFASIDEAVQISNILLLIVGISMLIVGIIIVAITAKSIAKPVKDLSRIAKSMQNLDFTEKYKSNRKDEINSLGESINALSEKLEQTIGELYEKNEKLERDIELISKIDSKRKEFIANASHELKTPVALIKGYAEGLEDNIASDNETRKIYTSVITEEADRMDYIIRQMLSLMELDADASSVERAEFSLSELVKEAINSFEVVIKGQNISLEYEADGDNLINADRDKIYQAVTNYISNAINHVDDKKIIRVLVKNLSDKTVFMVYNTGGPISEDEKQNIWERFYKVDKAHTREYGGSGLGLSIVRSVIELHGGEYGFENTTDGVQFYFSLNKELNDEI